MLFHFAVHKDKENAPTPKTSFMRNTEIRGSVKRKRGDDGERQSRDEQDIHRTKRHKKSSILASSKNPASPNVRKARGQAIELPKLVFTVTVDIIQ